MVLTVGGALDGGVLESDSLNGVVGATTDTANGQTVATRAETTAESDVLERVSTRAKESEM